jgi:hypothetical protein
MSTAGADTPPLSIVLCTKDPWPTLQRALDALHGQAASAGGEIVVGVSTPNAIPPDAPERYPVARWIHEPDASVFRLRAAALAACRAPIVAITEDHAYVDAGWCRAVLAAHAEHPDAAAIGGVVENGALRTLADRVGFLIANGPFLSPIRVGPSREISQQANVSYRRDALPRGSAPLGFMVHTFHETLRARGAVLRTDARMVVFHVQELSLVGHMVGHFHNGRSIAAFRATRMAPGLRAIRALACVVLPPVMLTRTLATVLRKRRFDGAVLLGLPLMTWLLCCHAAGEMVGYVTGPGRSPEHVN